MILVGSVYTGPCAPIENDTTTECIKQLMVEQKTELIFCGDIENYPEKTRSCKLRNSALDIEETENCTADKKNLQERKIPFLSFHYKFHSQRRLMLMKRNNYFNSTLHTICSKNNNNNKLNKTN